MRSNTMKFEQFKKIIEDSDLSSENAEYVLGLWVD